MRWEGRESGINDLGRYGTSGLERYGGWYKEIRKIQ